MTTYWTEFIEILLPGLMFMAVSALPLALSTLAAFRHLRKNNVGSYVRNIWSSTAAGLVTLGFLFGALFGSDLSKSSTAGLIFVWMPIYAVIALGIGYGVGSLAYKELAALSENTSTQPVISKGYRRFIWVPAAILSVLIFGMLRYSIQHNDLAVAESASKSDTLHYLYGKVLRGEADSFRVPLFLAQNPNTPSDILTALARHDHPTVRRFVATHPNTPLDVVASIKDYASDCTREPVEERLKVPSESNPTLKRDCAKARSPLAPR